MSSTLAPEKQQRRDALLHILEGGVLIGTYVAVNPNTVGASMVADLGGPGWAVAFMPVATMVGYSLGPILSAHLLDGQTHFKPILRRHLPLHRLFPLLAALSLLFLGRSAVSLWVVLLAQLLAGIVGGLTIGAWQQLVASTVPVERRPSVFGARYLLSTALGLGMGFLVAGVLARYPGTGGYALLHLVSFLGGTISYFALMGVKEAPPEQTPESAAPSARLGFLDNLREIPGIFASDRRLRLYLASATLSNAPFLYLGFLGLHARHLLGQPGSYTGQLTSAQMLGAVVGTLAAVLLGRWRGPAFMLIAGRILLTLSAVLALSAHTDWAFRLAFATYGAAFYVGLIGHNTLCLLLPPPGKRSTVLAAFSLVQVPAMLIAGQTGAWMLRLGLSYTWVVALGGLVSLISLLVSLPIQEAPAMEGNAGISPSELQPAE